MTEQNPLSITEDAGDEPADRDAAAGMRKIKITINIDQDILAALRAEAARTGVPYQRRINQLLRQALQKDNEMESRLERLERKFTKLKRKLGG
jgi:uncharacterized protein (DUF4415 family)